MLLSRTVLAQSGWQTLGDLVGVDEHANQVELAAQRGKVRIIVVAPDVIRVTYAPNGTFPPDQSFAVIPGAFPTNTQLKISKNDAGAELRTKQLVVRIDKSPLRLTFLDTTGKVLSQERADHPASFNGTEFRSWRTMPDDEHYFGLGDKTGPLDHRDLLFCHEQRHVWLAGVDRPAL